MGGGKVSVGAPFFDATFVPLMVPVLMACVAGALMPWKRGDLGAVLQRLRVAFVAALLVGLATWYAAAGNQVLAACGAALAVWLVAGSTVEFAGRIGLFRVPLGTTLTRARGLPRSAWGMTIAHASLGITVAGITAASAWQTESIRMMRPGETEDVAGYAFTFEGTRPISGPNYSGTEGTFTVSRGGTTIVRLTPQKRNYPAEGSSTTEAAIHTLWTGDLYAVLGEAGKDGAWSTRLYHNPLVAWIWIGAVFMALGGVISLTDRRHRVGAPRRAAPAAGAAAKA